MTRARRGLSEVLGAFMLVVIMLGAAATIYTLEMRASSTAMDTIESAKKGLAAILSPPIVKVTTRAGSVYAVLTSDTGATIRAIIVLPAGGQHVFVRGPILLPPGEPVEVLLYNGSCKPFRILLAPEGAPPIRYPQRGYYCDPGSKPELVDPATGTPMIAVTALPPLNITASNPARSSIELRIVGKVSLDGPSRLYPLQVYVDGSVLGAITPLEGRVPIGSIGPLNASIVGRKIPGAYVLLLYLEPRDGYYVVEASAESNASIYMSSPGVISVCTSTSNWIAPTPLAAITSNFSMSGTCIIRGSNVGYDLRGQLHAEARLLAANSIILLTAANDKQVWLNASFTLNISVYRVDPVTGEAAVTSTGLPLEVYYERPRPLVGSAYMAQLKLLSTNLSRLVDPTIVRASLYDNGSLLGEWELTPLKTNITVRGGFPRVNATIQVAQLLPAVQAWWLKLSVTSTLSAETTVYYLSGSLGVMSGPQPWAFPARITLRSPSGTMVLVAGSDWPLPGLGPIGAVFPATSALESPAGEVLAVRGSCEPYSYAATLATGAPREFVPPLRPSALAEAYGTPALIMVYAPMGSLSLPWGGSVDALAGQALWVN